MEDRQLGGGIDVSGTAPVANGELTVGNVRRGVRSDVVTGSCQWRGDAESWIAEVLAAEGVLVTGDLSEYRSQPWSSLWTIATDHGQGDFLPTNVFLPRRGGHFRVFDFAASGITLCSMRTSRSGSNSRRLVNCAT